MSPKPDGRFLKPACTREGGSHGAPPTSRETACAVLVLLHRVAERLQGSVPYPHSAQALSLPHPKGFSTYASLSKDWLHVCCVRDQGGAVVAPTLL